MFDHILVPLDGSERSEIVIPYVKELAEYFNSSLSIMGIYKTPDESIQRLFRDYLNDKVKKLEYIGFKTKAVFQSGNASNEIIRYASDTNCDLIVMSTQGRSGIGGVQVLGHITENVLRNTNKPLLLIPQKLETKDIKQQIFKRVLTPLDGSETGEAALSFAVEIAKKMATRLYVLNVILAHYRVTSGINYAAKLQRQLSETLRSQAMEYLNQIATELDKAYLDIKYDLVKGLPASAILDYVRDNHIDLIAISTHGETGFRRFVLGSVSDKIAHASHVPVLIVHVSKTQTI